MAVDLTRVAKTLEDGTKLYNADCPDCMSVSGGAEGCDACEGTGHVLVPASPSQAQASLTTQESEEKARTDTESGKLNGGLDAREMAQRSVAARKRNREVAEQEADTAANGIADEAVLVRVTVGTGSIIKKLAADAGRGNTQAARELRAWLAEVRQEKDTDVSDLDRTTRQRLLARLLLEVEGVDEGTLYVWQGGKLVRAEGLMEGTERA